MVSAPPTSGGGYPPPGYPPAGPGAPSAGSTPRGKTVPVLAVLVVLFVIATGVLASLFVTKNSDYDKQSKTLRAREQSISTLNKQLNIANDQIKSLQGQLDDANQKAEGSQNQVDELTHEKQVISQCLDLTGQAVDAASRGDETTANKLMNQADPVCQEAEGYLN